MRLAHLTITAGMCAIPLCAWAGASMYGSSDTPSLAAAPASFAVVDRAHKSDRLNHAFATAGSDASVAGVEIAGPLDAAITVRDRDGRVIYRADPANRLTIIAKRNNGATPVAPTQESGGPAKPVSEPSGTEMPDGCEGAFSPYAAPKMAHVIGRCISALPTDMHVASLTP